MKLFELTENTKKSGDVTLTQIRAVVDFKDVKVGDLGGWVEDEKSIGDVCWVYQGTDVYKEAKILGGEIYGGVIHGGEIYAGEIHGGNIYGGTILGAKIEGGVIYGGLIRGGRIRGGEIRGGTIYNGVIYGGTIHNGVIHGGEIYAGEIHGGEIRGGTILGAKIEGGVIYNGVIHHGEIHGGEIHGGEIHGGQINHNNYMGFSNVGSESGYLLAYVDSGKIMVSRGCFHGTLDEFYEAVEKTHGNNEFAEFYKTLKPIIEAKLNRFLNQRSQP